MITIINSIKVKPRRRTCEERIAQDFSRPPLDSWFHVGNSLRDPELLGVPPKKAQEPQFKVYRASMKRFWPIAGAAVAVAALGIAGGIYELTVGIPKELDEPGLRLMTGYLPIAFSLFLILLAGWAFTGNRKRQFTFRPDCLLYENGEQHLPIRWRNVTLLRPQRMKGNFLVATVSDGTSFARIEMFYFPMFEEMISEIDYQRRAGRAEHSV